MNYEQEVRKENPIINRNCDSLELGKLIFLAFVFRDIDINANTLEH